jgi:hypothetical protein
METELGNPIEYTPAIPDRDLDDDVKDDEEVNASMLDPSYYYQHPPQPPPQFYPPPQNNDFFSNLDKTAYVVIFVAFILGYFMGKTMQPVILRPA